MNNAATYDSGQVQKPSFEPLHPLFPHVPFKGSYGVREAARNLVFSRSKLHQAIDMGHLSVIRLGPKSIRIPGAELRAFIEARLVDPGA